MSNSQSRKHNPHVEHYFLVSFRDELFALINFLRYQWYVVALVVLSLIVLLTLVSPLPPRHVRVASGQENSTIEIIAKKYQQSLALHGVTMELVRTKGAIENLELLKQGQVDIAISQGGAPLGGATGIVSLGSIGYQPLWYFYRGARPGNEDVFAFMAGKRVSVALTGSGTRTVVDSVLSSLDPSVRAAMKEVELSAADSITALKTGRIDGMFLLAGIESGNAQALLSEPGVHVLDFPIAPALNKRLPYAEEVVLPQGAVRLSPPYPPEDIRMIATTTTLLTRADMHPAIQNMLLTAGTDQHRIETDFFARPGGFPAFVDTAVPRSPIAQRYFSSGPPLLQGYVPQWLATFIDMAWVWILGLLAVMYPLLRLVPSYRKTMFDIVASDKYARLFEIYLAVDSKLSVEEQKLLVQRYEALEQDIEHMWVPKGTKEAFGFLMCAMQLLRDRIQMLRQGL